MILQAPAEHPRKLGRFPAVSVLSYFVTIYHHMGDMSDLSYFVMI